MMIDYSKLAIDRVRNNAKDKAVEDRIYLEQICEQFDVSVDELIEHFLQNQVTINFQLDRLASNGLTVLENLLAQGQYYSQFRTGTTNGGKTAFVGGERYLCKIV
jgi:hypothetical protein